MMFLDKVLGPLIGCLLGMTAAHALEPIRLSQDGTHFVRGSQQERFLIWGVNYDHDRDGRLLDEYWDDAWSTVVEDFKEIKALGANCVRVHLQLGKFLESPATPNQQALQRLTELVRLAESLELYLDITGLACYHRANIPAWYDQLDEQQRWQAQKVFWQAVAQACAASPAIFCYDLMNEPILPGNKVETEWLTGELAGKYFVQRISLDLRGRTRDEVAKAWINSLVDGIREHDQQHLITVGVIPWVFVFGGGQPLFHSPEVGQRLDFVAVHFYPKRGEVDKALQALKAYDVGKPIVIEEMFPLACDVAELTDFIHQSASLVDGYVSFYWGATADELRAPQPPSLAAAITASWLDNYSQLSQELQSAVPAPQP